MYTVRGTRSTATVVRTGENGLCGVRSKKFYGEVSCESLEAVGIHDS